MLDRDPEKNITFVNNRSGADHRYALACDKINSELAWHTNIELKQGLKTTIDYYRKQIKKA